MSDATLTADLVHAADGPRGLWSWITTTNHKRIGLLYIGTSIVYFLVAVGFAMLMRAQLLGPSRSVVSAERYNQIFSMHATAMIFLFAMPILGGGLANYLIPLMIGARDMAFPRLNALSYWLFAFGGLLLFSSFIFGGGGLDTGWYSYSPLTAVAFSPHDGVTFWTVAIIMVGASSVLGAVNFIVTMMKLRAPGMTFFRMPLFALATYINSFLILYAIPSLTAALIMLYLDRKHGTVFFDALRGGDPVIWAHLFWFFGHPEVYVLILPAFGILSEVTPVFSRKPLFGRNSMILMIGIIGLLSFGVWGHHMFTFGLPSSFDVAMAATSMLIAVPTGVKIFNWLATMWGGSLRFDTPLLFVAGFIGFFVIGGLTGVMLAAYPFDWQANGTYFLVGHLHNVLFGGTLFGVFAGLYYWFPKMTGHFLNDRLGKLHFWLIFPGALLTFLPMYALGLLGMPRRVYTYAPNRAWDILNAISSLGGFLIGVAILVFVVNIVVSLRDGKPAPDNPWGAWTLEWATTSPPPVSNFVTLPLVTSERPIWDWEHAAVATASAGAQSYPPEIDLSYPPSDVSVVYPIVEPDAEQTSVLPLMAGVSLLIVAIGLLSSLWIAAAGAVLLIDVMVRWAWFPWSGPDVPFLSNERFSARGAGMVLFIGSESIFFGVLIYSYLHLRIHLGVWPPPGVPGLGLKLAGVNTVVLLSSGVAAGWALKAFRKGLMPRCRRWILVTMLLGVGFLGGQVWEYTHAGFSFSGGLMGSTFFTLTGFHGGHVTAGLLLMAFMFIRSFRQEKMGAASPDKGTTGLMEAGTYYWHFVDAVWVVLFSVLYLL